MKNTASSTLTIDALRQMANKPGRARNDARKALTRAEGLRQLNNLGSISYDPKANTFQISEARQKPSMAAAT